MYNFVHFETGLKVSMYNFSKIVHSDFGKVTLFIMKINEIDIRNTKIFACGAN